MAFKIKRHDTRPRYVVPLVDNFGEVDEAPIDLTTCEKVFFIMREKGSEGGEPLVKKEGEIKSPKSAGIVQYTWEASNTATVGTYNVEWELHWEDGGIETVPNETFFEVVVVGDLG